MVINHLHPLGAHPPSKGSPYFMAIIGKQNTVDPIQMDGKNIDKKMSIFKNWGSSLHVNIVFGHFWTALLFIPRAPMTSMFEGQPLKTRPFPGKTRVIWILGMYIYIYNIIYMPNVP